MMNRRIATFLVVGVLLAAVPLRGETFQLSATVVIQDQEVKSIGSAKYTPNPLCLQCPWYGNHRISGASASATWSFVDNGHDYEGTLSDWISDGQCYKGAIEAWGAEGGHGEYQSAQKCAPCILFTEFYGDGSISGAPIGKSTHNCGASISLTAQPASGWRFTNWGGSISSTSAALSFTLDASKSLTAFFDQIPPPPPPPPQHTACVQGNNECQDPLILDLNGDGIHTTGINDPVWFDMDGDGLLEQTAWTNASTAEGFLYLDLDHKGRVTNGSELFGVGTVMPDGSRGRDGFTALALYDIVAHGGNGDGILDASDAVWNRLRIWVDADHDGICDANETGPIHKYGIREIEIAAVSSNVIDDAGNLHKLSSLYHRKNRDDAIHAIGFQRLR